MQGKSKVDWKSGTRPSFLPPFNPPFCLGVTSKERKKKERRGLTRNFVFLRKVAAAANLSCRSFVLLRPSFDFLVWQSKTFSFSLRTREREENLLQWLLDRRSLSWTFERKAKHHRGKKKKGKHGDSRGNADLCVQLFLSLSTLKEKPVSAQSKQTLRVGCGGNIRRRQSYPHTSPSFPFFRNCEEKPWELSHFLWGIRE